ncbi:vicilin Cor a 11.0101 [Rutidosis leptorrhynchoides]|uniref:vicilin Cor a 11.0101 n=1 Tax=Rutidosis leptorrhynchoides TaxID=125765 RepID=UPI003A98F999
MGVKGKICVVFLLFVGVVLISANLSVAKSEREPEIRICRTKCEDIGSVEEAEKQGCRQKCEKYFQEKQRKERQGGQEPRGSGGGYNIVFAEQEQELQKMVQDCHQSCQGSEGEQRRPECFQQCMEKKLQEQGQQRKGSGSHNKHHKQKSKKSDQGSNNPYVFQEQHFTTRLETELGNVRILQKFTDRSKDLFKGIEKYRVVFLEAEPQTFVVPHHYDADALIFVVNGEGTLTFVNLNSRESHNIRRGDILRIPAGFMAYLINRHNTERLVLTEILHSVSVPGDLQKFYSVGVDNIETSFFDAFSTEVLEAAFNVDQESLERLFSGQQQEQGIFKKATEEQIRSMSGRDEGRIWPFGERKQGPFNIYRNRPSVANENGVLHEVDSNDLPELREMNVGFSHFNITQGSMAGPIYNTKATVALVVVNGEGQFEMACPHLTEQTSSSDSGFTQGYTQVTSDLRRGTVVVIPAGHPIVIEASNNQDLEVIGFGLNTNENEWFPLAGRDNVISQWEDEAIELTFGLPAREVQRVIQRQNQRFFFKGPMSSGRASA